MVMINGGPVCKGIEVHSVVGGPANAQEAFGRLEARLGSVDSATYTDGYGTEFKIERSRDWFGNGSTIVVLRSHQGSQVPPYQIYRFRNDEGNYTSESVPFGDNYLITAAFYTTTPLTFASEKYFNDSLDALHWALLFEAQAQHRCEYGFARFGMMY